MKENGTEITLANVMRQQQIKYERQNKIYQLIAVCCGVYVNNSVLKKYWITCYEMK